MRFICFVVCGLAAFFGAAQAQTPTVSDLMTFNVRAGEAQSTVVAPGQNAACPQGRVLVSNDLARPPLQGPPARGLVFGRDVTATNTPPIEATFDGPPNGGDYRFGTNDHDLVALGDGTVLYATGAFSKVLLYPKPAWFDVSYRGDFGPGARSNVMVWRSTDCGGSFHFVSEFDPARMIDGSCALPQHQRDSAGHITAPLTTPPGSTAHPVYDMGGSDGQTVRVNPATGRIYLTFQCVGFQVDTSIKDRFALSQTPLNKTLVAVSLDSAGTWSPIGFVPYANWRFGVVPIGDDRLVFGLGTGFTQGRRDPIGSFKFDASGVLVPGLSWGWPQAFYANAKIQKLKAVYANIWASTIVSRVPGGRLVLIAVPAATPTGTGGNGYRVFFYDPNAGYAEIGAVFPQSKSANDFILHLGAIDLGAGPVLLYWSDFSTDAGRATVRGRLILENGFSNDFQIAQQNGAPAYWMLQQGSNYWYGDYQTAWGYTSVTSGPIATRQVVSHYFPMWPQADNTIRYAQVTVSQPLISIANAAGPSLTGLNIHTLSRSDWNLQPQTKALERIVRSRQEMEEVEEYGFHASGIHK